MKVKFRLSLNGILQYLFLYLFFMSHDTAIYRENTMLFRILITLCCVMVFVFNKTFWKIEKDYILFFTIVSFFLLVRGERKLWLSYAEYILLIFVTYRINKNLFCERFVKITIFFTIISLIFYTVGRLSPNLLINNIPMNNVEWSFYGRPYYLQGRLLYVVRKMELERNNSIFTEPGLFQMFLNTALFMLLFMREYLPNIKNEKINIMAIVLIIAVITTGSTTSYIALSMILIVFIINHRSLIRQQEKKHEIRKTIRIIVGFSVLTIIGIFIDYTFNGESSILFKFFIRKIAEMFSDGTSGHARTSMISICLNIVSDYPILGAGEDYVSSALRILDDGANGGILIHSFASIGIVPVLAILFYYFKNIVKQYVPIMNALLIVALYLNTSLAQSRLLYPALLIVPIVYGDYCCYKNETIKSSLKLKG